MGGWVGGWEGGLVTFPWSDGWVGGLPCPGVVLRVVGKGLGASIGGRGWVGGWVGYLSVELGGEWLKGV